MNGNFVGWLEELTVAWSVNCDHFYGSVDSISVAGRPGGLEQARVEIAVHEYDRIALRTAVLAPR